MRSSLARLLCPPFARRPLAVACLLGLLPAAHAATYAVTTEAELYQAILDVNASTGAHFIDLRANIELTAALPPITNTVSIRGNGHILDGQEQYQLLVVGDPAGVGPRILVQVSNLNLIRGVAEGSDGSGGGGGGLGAGGALQVNSRADVLLSGVSVQDSTALGGTGGAGLGGDGGGYEGGSGGLGAVGDAGDGGFGAGGGSSSTALGGDGGVGAGGGGGATGGGSGGLGGGDGGTTGGGGGAGLGGGIFVADGGSLSISGDSEVSGNGAGGGLPSGDGSGGAAAGSGIFLAGSGNLLLRVNGTQRLNLYDDISDSVGAGLAPVGSYDRWNVLVAGGGAQLIDPSDPDQGFGYGTVVLGGSNLFAGNLYVEGADVAVNNLSGLGVGDGVVALNDGGLVIAGGLTLTRDMVVDNDGGRIGVGNGIATLANDISGTGDMSKTGFGDLILAGTSSHVGAWKVQAGNLVLDSDARLGSSELVLAGGGIRFAADFDDLRSIELVGEGAIDNGGFAVTLNGVTSWGADDTMVFRGTGTTTLAGAQTGRGNTLVEEGTVEGAIGAGGLELGADTVYRLGGDHRVVGALNGTGDVELGAHTLTIAMGVDDELATSFSGTVSGSGGLFITRTGLPADFDPLADLDAYRMQYIGGGNSHGGGIRVGEGAIAALADDSSVGTGPLQLSGGAFYVVAGSSSLDVELLGGGGVFGDLVFDGVISGTGTFVKYGAGTLTLNNANTYVGDTLVVGEGAYIELAHANAIGNGNLQLSLGGGLRVLTDTASLRPIQILDGVGVVDVGSHDVQSVGGITGFAADSALRKEGSGRLLLTGALDLAGGVQIAEGLLQVGNGGVDGSIGGDVAIASGAQLAINRSGTLTLDGNITGAGSVLVNGSGTVHFNPGEANTFLGGLTVLNGTVSAASELALGAGDVTLDANGGLLMLGDVDRDLIIGSGGGRLIVDGSDTVTFDGDLTQSGLLSKTGTGTLVITGVAGEGGDVRVAAGTLQVGSGLEGVLAGDVAVDAGATLVFGRGDLTQYGHVISGDGTVVKRGAGELVLTADQLFAGTFQVETGNLRVGLGGSSGALNGDVDLASGTRLIFDRGDDSIFFGDTGGAGLVQKSGPGLLTVVGDLDHTGGTQVTSGDLQIGNGGAVGSIGGAVALVSGTRLVINRGDDVSIDASLSGAGTLVQRGDGNTVLTGTNTQTGGVLIEGGRLGVDSDARLGVGELIMDGGLLRYEAAFDDLRAIRLRSGGGGLDTNGFDVAYSGQVSGSSLFTKAGAGRLTVTSLLGVDVSVDGGELRIGDGATEGLLTGDATVATGATLAFDRSDLVNVTGALSGGGDLRQLGAGELRLPGDNSAFAGHTYIDNGNLRLDGTLGGDLTLATGTWLQGTGTLLGSLDASAGRIAPGNSFGTLTIGGDLALGAASELTIEVDASGASDRIDVGGTATLGGLLKVVPQPGDYTAAGCCSYTVLTAAAVTGTFDSVSNDLVFLDTEVLYQPTTVQIAFTRNAVGFNTVSLTWNQQQVATAIDAMEADDPADPVAALITPLSADQARDAFDRLSGDSLLVAANMSARSASRFTQMLSRRSSRLGLVSRGGAPTFAPGSGSAPRYDGPTSRIEGVWAEAAVLELSESADATVGSAAGSLEAPLLMLGADGYWRDELLLGFAAGLLDGDLAFDNRSAEGSASATFLGVYGRWDSGAGLQYKGALSIATQDNDVTRHVDIGATSARTQGTLATRTLGLALEAGLPLHVATLGLRPYALLNVQALDSDEMKETGDPDVALTAGAASAVLGEFGIGLELSRPWLTAGERWAQISGGLSLLQPFGDTQQELTLRFSHASVPYAVRATPADSVALGLNLGGEVYLTPQWSLWGGYEGRVSGVTQEHGGVLGLQYRW